MNQIVLAHLHIKALRNIFPARQFKIPGYASPFGLDQNQNGGGILVFVREDIPVKFLSSEEKLIEVFFLNLIFIKRLSCCSYNPNKSNISRHLDILRNSLDLYSAHYENTILIGDFNFSIDDLHMEPFCELYRFKSLIKDPNCFKNPENSSCIDLILTNSPYSF